MQIEGHSKMQPTHIQPAPPPSIEIARRRIRARRFVCHMLGITDWTTIGKPWVKRLKQFVDTWRPSRKAFIQLDQVTRDQVIYLTRFERN